MRNVIAIVPARQHSRGIPGKNFRELGGLSLIEHAIDCAQAAQVPRVYVSTDAGLDAYSFRGVHGCEVDHIKRPAHLAQDDTPMYDVVKHAADTLGLRDDDIIVLLQPTQPFRKPEHVTRAVELLRETQADSVVSVVPLPLTHHPLFQLAMAPAVLFPPVGALVPWYQSGLENLPSNRQDVPPTYRRDGTVYALLAKTLRSGHLYGDRAVPLILDPSESCELDTEDDWKAVTERWQKERA